MLPPTAQTVFEALAEMPVIDSHQHLLPEKRRTDMKVDFFLLFSTYCREDLLSVGMPEEVYNRLRNEQDMPVEQKWQIFEPYWPLIKHGSYARPARIWLEEVLGHEDLTAENYREVSEQLQAANTPGLYQRVLADMCHIETSIVCSHSYDEYDPPLLRSLWWLTNLYTSWARVGQFVESTPEKSDQTLEAYLDWVEVEAERLLAGGVVGVKLVGGIVGVKLVAPHWNEPDTDAAGRIFESIRDGGPKRPSSVEEHKRLGAVVVRRALEFAGKHNLTVAVHTGVWGDFRELNPTHLIPLLQQVPNVRFDIYHVGVPYVREAVMMAKMFPNCSLDFCWTHVISQELSVRMLDECLEMLPLNQLIAFGADYNFPVEKTYGHLKMAKENVARVLAKRIDQGRLDTDEALRIARLWFYENPKAIYGLGTKG